jgi:hypothetical protein
MQRRAFISSLIGGLGASAVSSAAAPGNGTQASAPPQGAPEFYAWQHYILRSGTQQQRMTDFLQNAAIPALNRLGHQPIGAFEVVAGAVTPSLFVLIPMRSPDGLASMEASLVKDTEFVKAAAPYIDAPANDPAYERREVSLLAAFAKMPRLQIPAQTADKRPRLFELRTYESHSEKAHRAKVQMFEELGEMDIFRRVGLKAVFFSHTLAGPRMPSLVYMLVHDNFADRDKNWAAFSADPEWKKLSGLAGYGNADIVSNITSIYLRPAAYSQI